jgi:hypothetical protein
MQVIGWARRCRRRTRRRVDWEGAILLFSSRIVFLSGPKGEIKILEIQEIENSGQVPTLKIHTAVDH